MATCSVIDLAFNRLWTREVLKEGSTKIEDISRFNDYNQIYTEIAKSKYKVDDEGMFFNIETRQLSNVGPLDRWGRARRSSSPANFAVVNREFVDKFQDKFDSYKEPSKAGTQLELFKETLSKPFVLTPEKYSELKDVIEYKYIAEERDKMLDALSKINSHQELGSLLLKLCK